ncbi:nitroreductase family protein [Ruminococcus gauvreauii]|uniref:Nitroreductase family protein n=1 Tax=Ruminococcus gauvreauii TaxID=438033 RepID=A0ABY5VHM2_9FIRM|nr:nitroreductase family protein [Ruminococcus gauvreauii]UWP59543.1 nitroreductase family protein [Ruminococcus gauvreauii]
MITIDQRKCIGCGQCIQVCPFTVLKRGDGGKAVHTGKPCVACMHCAAVCPKEAITYDGESAVSEKVRPLPEQCSAAVEQLIFQRRSYRRFQKKQVPRELIKKALDAAMIAPSAKNQHPDRWILIETEAVKTELMELILLHCKENQVSMEILSEYENHNNPVMGENAVLLIGVCKDDALNPWQDTAIALASAELILQAEGVGTCWGGYLTRFVNAIPKCRNLLGISDGSSAYGSLMLGYPEGQQYRKIPVRLVKAEVTRF